MSLTTNWKNLKMNKMKYHIKPYLKKRSINLSSLAKQIGMSFQRLDHHIKLKENLSLNVARKLSEALGMKLEVFIKEVEVADNNIEEEMENQPFAD